MKYLTQLSEEEIKKLITFYTGDAEIIEFSVETDTNSVYVDCLIRICIEPDGEMVTCNDRYELNDYNVAVYDWGGNESECLYNYRKWLLQRFGPQYAEDYLLCRLHK